MGYKFTKIPVDTFENLVMNAGIICKSFDASTGEASGQIGATKGGITATCTPSFEDMGDDIDNCPKNMMELKKITEYDVKVSGTFVTINEETAELLLGAVDNASGVLSPRMTLSSADFNDLWVVADYSDVNTGANAGFVAIHILNALNTSGFSLKTADKAKGEFSFELTGHVSMDNQDKVPFEVIIGGGAGDQPYITLDKHVLNIAVDDEVTLGYEVNPSSASVTFVSSASGKASVTSAGVVKGLEAGSTIITASITDNGITYSDTCTVVVSAG